MEKAASMTLEEALTSALDDEYRARATYQAVLDAFGDARPFVNIVESEKGGRRRRHRGGGSWHEVGRE